VVRISRLLGLSRTNQRLLLQATILLAAARIGLKTMSFATLRNILSKLATTGTGRIDPAAHDDTARQRIIWAVETAGRHFPAIGTCLTEALAAHVLLARIGHQSNLQIGVTRDQNGKFVAHAWLEEDGAIVLGENWARHYTPMPKLNGLEP
jgi:hypothetical protein